ncbi:hypothetical protein Tco_0181260, partial [Tanacetum coccineum]
METIHIEFDEMMTMAFEQFGSGPELQLMTPRTISLGLMQNPSSLTPYLSPTVISRVLSAIASIPADTTGTPSSSTIDQDEPSVTNQPLEHLRKWTKNHPLNNVIGNPSRPVSTRRQLQTDAMWCYFDAFLTSVKPKNYKEALKESCWIEAMQEEIHE